MSIHEHTTDKERDITNKKTDTRKIKHKLIKRVKGPQPNISVAFLHML